MINGVLCRVFHKKEIKVKDVFSAFFNFSLNAFLTFAPIGVILWIVYLNYTFYFNAGFGYLGSVAFALIYTLLIIPISLLEAALTLIIFIGVWCAVERCIRKCANFTVATCPKYVKTIDKESYAGRRD